MNEVIFSYPIFVEGFEIVEAYTTDIYFAWDQYEAAYKYVMNIMQTNEDFGMDLFNQLEHYYVIAIGGEDIYVR